MTPSRVIVGAELLCDEQGFSPRRYRALKELGEGFTVLLSNRQMHLPEPQLVSDDDWIVDPLDADEVTQESMSAILCNPTVFWADSLWLPRLRELAWKNGCLCLFPSHAEIRPVETETWETFLLTYQPLWIENSVSFLRS